MKRLDKPSKHMVGANLLNIEIQSDVSCNLLSIRELFECLKSSDALFCSDVSDLLPCLRKNLAEM